MPNPPIEVTDLDQAPEEYRADYVETDGKFVFDLDKHVAGLKNGLKAEREQRRSATEKLSGLQAELAELKDKQEQTPQGKQKATDDDRIAKLEKMIADERAAREAKENELRSRDDRDTLRRAFLAAGGIEEDADDVLVLVREQFGRDDTGALVITSADDPLLKSPEEFFAKEFRAKRPKFFKAKQQGGGGAAPGRSGGAASVKSVSGLADSEKVAYIKEFGIKAYQELVDATHSKK